MSMCKSTHCLRDAVPSTGGLCLKHFRQQQNDLAAVNRIARGISDKGTTCPRCTLPVRAGAAYCPNCGRNRRWLGRVSGVVRRAARADWRVPGLVVVCVGLWATVVKLASVSQSPNDNAGAVAFMLAIFFAAPLTIATGGLLIGSWRLPERR